MCTRNICAQTIIPILEAHLNTLTNHVERKHIKDQIQALATPQKAWILRSYGGAWSRTLDAWMDKHPLREDAQGQLRLQRNPHVSDLRELAAEIAVSAVNEFCAHGEA